MENFSEDRDLGAVAQAHYNLACLYSMTGRKRLALEHLKLSIEKGFLDFSWMKRDRDLESIKGDSRFEELQEMILDVHTKKDELKDRP